MNDNCIDSAQSAFDEYRSSQKYIESNEVRMLQEKIAELEEQVQALKSVLGEMVDEAKMQDAFEDAAGMMLLSSVSKLLEVEG